MSLKGSCSMLLLAIAMMAGCAETQIHGVFPNIAPVDTAGLRIKGNLDYENEDDYLPRTVMDEPNVVTPVKIKYSFKAYAGKDAFLSENPKGLDFIKGFFIGEEDGFIYRGSLEFYKNKRLLRSYTAYSGIKEEGKASVKGRIISDLRKKGLIAVRNNIESQMFNDRGTLLQLIKAK